jgi:hypothetical protein
VVSDKAVCVWYFYTRLTLAKFKRASGPKICARNVLVWECLLYKNQAITFQHYIINEKGYHKRIPFIITNHHRANPTTQPRYFSNTTAVLLEQNRARVTTPPRSCYNATALVLQRHRVHQMTCLKYL